MTCRSSRIHGVLKLLQDVPKRPLKNSSTPIRANKKRGSLQINQWVPRSIQQTQKPTGWSTSTCHGLWRWDHESQSRHLPIHNRGGPDPRARRRWHQTHSLLLKIPLRCQEELPYSWSQTSCKHESPQRMVTLCNQVSHQDPHGPLQPAVVHDKMRPKLLTGEMGHGTLSTTSYSSTKKGQ